MAQIRVVAGAPDPGARRKRRVHQHHGGMQAGQPVGDGLGVERGHHGFWKQPGQKPGACPGVFIEMQFAGGGIAECALGHDGEHAGAGRGLQHDVAGADGGGLQCGIGERQRRRELLQGKLFLRAFCLGRLQRRQGLQHLQHAARPVLAAAAGAAHAPSVTLAELIERTYRGVYLLTYLKQEKLDGSGKKTFFDRAAEGARIAQNKVFGSTDSNGNTR